MCAYVGKKNKFVSYWNAYASLDEAHKTDKTEWSAKSVSAGILRFAMEALSKLIVEPEEDFSQIVEIGNHVWVVEKALNYRGLRVSILGTDSTELNPPSVLASELLERCRESLCLCILPVSKHTIWPLYLQDTQVGAAGVIPVYPSDVDAMAQDHLTVSELVEYKLFRRLILGSPDPETQFDSRLVDDFKNLRKRVRHLKLQSLKDILEDLPENNREWVDHPLVPRVSDALQKGRGCLLIGPSSSGKSVLAFEVGRNFLFAGKRVIYINLGSLSDFPADIVDTFLFAQAENQPFLVIVDDLQSNPTGARYLLTIASSARRVRAKTSPVVLSISWVDFAREAAIWHENCLPIAVRPHQVRSMLARQYRNSLSDEDLQQLLYRLGDDLLLLKLSLDQSKRLGRRVSLADVAEQVWQSKTSNKPIDEQEAKRVALVAGSLGRYDISASPEFLKQEARVGEKTISKLLSTRLLRRQQTNVTIGHRSLCGLIVDWLEAQGAWQVLSQLHGSANAQAVVLNYLRSLGSSLKVDSLRALHARAGFKKTPQLNRRAAALVEIWQAFSTVVERMEKQQLVDPTWGHDVSSAMFAVQTFSHIGNLALAQKSLNFIRQHVSIEDDRLSIFTEGLATEADFLKTIPEAMQEEDELLGSPQPPAWVAVKDLDKDRFHKTWLMGIFLCAEAAAPQPIIPLNNLAALVESSQMDSGCFYPPRVPWSTARILLGLAACGRTVHTSSSVERAVNWLIRDCIEGGANRDGLWESGTGRWNTTLETTGIVLLALAAVGYDCSDPHLDVARSFLLSERSQWVASGSELDGAQAIQAYLDTGGEWENVAQEAQRLSQWARSETFWRGAGLSAEDSLDQSCRVAQIASYLIHIGWAAIRSDLPAFLDALVTPAQFRPDFGEVGRKPVQIRVKAVSKTKESEPALLTYEPVVECLLRIDELSLGKFTVVGKYRRFDERTRSRLIDWTKRIADPLLTPTVVHENFLIWGAPGSGKSFFTEEVARSIGATISFFELNLAKQSKEEFVKGLQDVMTCEKATLCMIDEIDARVEETWPYEECFSLLDLNLRSDRNVVFVLIGSSSTGLQGIVGEIMSRRKGKDLLDRIPVDRRFEIPALTIYDRVIIFGGHVADAAKDSGYLIDEIEKLAFYYVLINKEIQTPRQLRDLAVAAVHRVSKEDRRLKYDNLFFAGDRRNQLFWVDHQQAASELSDVFVRVAQ